MRHFLLAAALMAATGVSMAREAYWVDSNGQIVRDGHGNCLKTSFWTAEAAKTIKGCPGYVEPVAAAPAPAPAPAPTPVVKKINLNAGVLFAFDSAKLSPAGDKEIAKAAAEAKGMKSVSMVLVEGHTDNIGTAAYNQKLSLKRAMTVRDALVKHGVPADKIEAKGYGFDKPVATNKTRDGRQQNRRVEITINGTN